jgi:hypothetical protein
MPSLLPDVTVVIGVRVIPNRLLRAVLYVGVRVEFEIGTEFLRSSFMVLQIGQSLSVDMVRAREAVIVLVDVSICNTSAAYLDVTE